MKIKDESHDSQFYFILFFANIDLQVVPKHGVGNGELFPGQAKQDRQTGEFRGAGTK